MNWVEPPIIKAGHPEAEDEGRPGDDRMIRRHDDMKLGGVGREKWADAADGLESDEHRQRAAHDQRRALEKVGPGNGLEAAPGRVEGGDPADQPNRDDQVEIEDGVEGERPGVNDRGDAHADINGHEIQGHDAAGRGMVAVLQVFGNGIDPRPQEFRKKKERHDNEGGRGDPFVAGDGESGDAGALPRHPDEVLGRYVGGDERESDERPDEASSGQEKIFPRPLFAALEHAYAHDKGEEKGENRQVEPVQGHFGLRSQSGF